MTEEVLVVPRTVIEELGMFQGVSDQPERYLERILDPAVNFFLDRALAEEDPSYKQIIPYALFVHGDRVLSYRRGGGGGEKRLAAKLSIGIGGHINRSDAGAEHLGRMTYLKGVEREFAEEIKLPGGYQQEIVALLNDDSSPVGAVHLGVIHVVRLPVGEAESAETDLVDMTFRSRAELEELRTQLETWSAICLDHWDQLIG